MRVDSGGDPGGNETRRVTVVTSGFSATLEDDPQVSNAAPSSRRTVVREDSVPFERCGAGVVGFRLAVFVVVDPDVPCGAREPVGQHGGGGLHGNRGLVP